MKKATDHNHKYGDPIAILSQPSSIKELTSKERDKLIVSHKKIGKEFIVASRYGDECWQLTGATTNTIKARTRVDFTVLPVPYREVTKAMLYRLLRKGREGGVRATASTLVRVLQEIKTFVIYLCGVGISCLSDVTPLVCSTYAQVCRNKKVNRGSKRKPALLSTSSLRKRFTTVETIYELSQFTLDPMPSQPWAETSAEYLSGEHSSRRTGRAKTPLIPDDVFTTLFQKAWTIVQEAHRILDIRDAVCGVQVAHPTLSRSSLEAHQYAVLAEHGWEKGLVDLRTELTSIRTASYIVIASLSGCRIHEIAFLRTGSYFSTLDDDGRKYWWMRSRSSKTNVGDTEWMVPEAVIQALQVMERWVAPLQQQLCDEINALREKDPFDIVVADWI